MKIDVCILPQEASTERMKEHSVAVIDVLRASTTILFALENGARNVIPTDAVADAMGLAQQFERDSILLCGERDGVKIAGFDLGNSPTEYTVEAVSGKTLVYSSTNGSKTLLKSHGAKHSILASFNNLSAAARYLLSQGTDVTIVCSGKLERFALEDAVCAGVLVTVLCELVGESEYTLSDGAVAVAALAQQLQGDLLAMLKLSQHGSYLESIGMGSDLPICAAIDRFDFVPVFREGKIEKLLV
ncbi:MAG: 2-phosphosulfolactate phosphatase [bacterium]|nr:2-phosphosulfolactate phosphatase [bacterium]